MECRVLLTQEKKKEKRKSPLPKILRNNEKKSPRFYPKVVLLGLVKNLLNCRVKERRTIFIRNIESLEKYERILFFCSLCLDVVEDDSVLLRSVVSY